MTRSKSQHWSERWLPLLSTAVLQLVTGIWFAAHLSAAVQQNAKDIAALQMVVVPRPEFTEMQQDTKDRLDGMDSKLTQLLERKDEK